MKLISLPLWIGFLLLTTILGCSSADNSIITTASITAKPGYDILPTGITDWDTDGAIMGGTGALGLYQLHLDTINLSGELTSLRNNSFEDVLEVVDITNFMRLAPCVDCAKIRSVSLDSENHLVVSIGLKHPFQAGDPFKPISGRNRADLHVFNVEGVVISNLATTSFPTLGKSTAGFSLLNCDGYTSYLDNSIDEFYPTEASIHPYITHFDNYSAGNYSASNPMGFENVTNPGPGGNLVMPMGCDYNYQDYVLDVPISNPVDFIYAIECTYAVSAANKSMRFAPEYRLPQHNKKAASEVGIEIVSNDLEGENTTSSATLRISVVDINHGVAVGDALNEMRADSSVSAISVEVPGVTSGSVSFPTTPLSGSGHDPSDPLIFEGTITNASSAPEGDYAGLVKVTDSYPVGLNESPLLGSQDGIKRVDPLLNPLSGLFAIDEFATYQFFRISVSSGIQLSVISIDPVTGELDSGDIAATISGTGFDPDAEPKLVKNDNPSMELFGGNVTVNPGGTSIDCTFDMNSAGGAVTGIYNVVVTNPGPPLESAQLNNGFEIYVFTGCIETYRDEIYSGTMQNHSIYIYGCAFTHDGLLLSRVNAGGYHLYGFDVTQNGNISGVPVVSNALYMNNSIGDIDVCDVTGNIVYAICGGDWTDGLLNTFVVYSPDGVLIGEYQNENTDHLQGLDTDDDGSIWTVAHTYVNPDPGNLNTSPNEYFLNHYTWDEANARYEYDASKSINITSFQKYVPYVNIYDIAVSFADDLVLVYSYGSTYKGRIDAYDFSSGTTAHSYTKENLLPATVGAHAHYNWRSAGDIEIDHSDINHEYCRVLISARNYWTVGQSFSKLDTSGNVIDQWLNPNADAEDRFFWSHAINTLTSDPDGAYMVATEDTSSFGGNPARYHVFAVPEGW